MFMKHVKNSLNNVRLKIAQLFGGWFLVSNLSLVFGDLDKRSAKFQGYTRPRTDRFRQFDNKPSRETRQHALRLIPQAFSRTMDRHWTAHIALSLDALSSDKRLGFRLSQGGTFPTIDSWGHKNVTPLARFSSVNAAICKALHKVVEKPDNSI